MFNWIDFLRTHGIVYLDRGHNVSKGNVAIHCPFCGPADPSQHLNIHLKNRGWACWRNGDHRGKSNVRLVQALLQCDQDEARRIVYGNESRPEPTETLVSQMQAMLNPQAAQVVTRLKLPEAFKPLWKPSLFNAPHHGYLQGRGYSEGEVVSLAKRFNMHYATKGEWSGRVLFPITDEHGKLQSWTGRAIGTKDTLRYRSLDRERSVVPVSESLFDLPHLVKQTGTLVICEGVFDAMRITWFGHPMNVHATCLFTLLTTRRQVLLLRRLRQQFKRVVLLLDQGTFIQSAQLQLNLDIPRLEAVVVPDGVKDPGALRGSQALTLCRQLACSQ